MSVVTEARAVADAVKERLGPTVQEIERGIDRGRRVVDEGRIAVEDGVAKARWQIRRHPLVAVTTAAGAGAFVGSIAGFVCSRLCTKRT